MKEQDQGVQCPPRAKKQNHANIPCPIENCARFTYGKLPDHLTKRHGLTGKERDLVNERQRKRFFNGELCQVRFLKEAAIIDLWGEEYNDPKIRKKIHDSYTMVKIRIIPVSATNNRILPLTEQDANVLTNYNARTITKTPKKKRKVEDEIVNENKRRKSCESSSESEENNNFLETHSSTIPSVDSTPPSSSETDTTHYTYEIIDGETSSEGEHLFREIFDSKLEDKYKHVINDMKKSMIMGRTLSSKKLRTYRTYRRYAKRLISFLQKQNSYTTDIDDLLGDEKYVTFFFDKIKQTFKLKTQRNYIIASIKLLDSRLFIIETDPSCKSKVCLMTKVYNLLHKYLMECVERLPKKEKPLSESL